MRNCWKSLEGLGKKCEIFHGVPENGFLLVAWNIVGWNILENNEKARKSAKTGEKESDKKKRT